MKWVLIRSWHGIASRFTSRGGHGMATTYCGRRVIVEAVIRPGMDEVRAHVVAADLPAGKSCESCLRIIARRADA